MLQIPAALMALLLGFDINKVFNVGIVDISNGLLSLSEYHKMAIQDRL